MTKKPPNALQRLSRWRMRQELAVKNIDDGGCAFPNLFRLDDGGSIGMSLRDYFAAKAMQGIKSNPDHSDSTSFNYANIADEAYKIADAMIAARR